MEYFVDRESEMVTLQNEYKREGSSLVIVYGRRGIGKTLLISRFIKDKKALFFLAGEESEPQNRSEFKRKAADFLENDLLKSVDVKNWEIIFKTIADTPFDRKPVIVLDEFQHIGKSNPEFLSVFQYIWDTMLKNKSVMVILCGSRVSAMESQTLAHHSPLCGLSTAQIRIRQIPFSHYHNFFRDKSRRELIELYSVTGGIPKYIEPFTAGGDIYELIQACVLNRSGYLYDEPYLLLQQEVMEIGSYFSILKAVAEGKRKMASISTALESKATGLTKYLKTLIDLDIMEREVPVTEENPEKCKRGLYKIKDNYIRFWFAFIFPNMSFIESGNSRVVADWIRANLTGGHTVYVYEDICRERMWNIAKEGACPFHISKIGRWWDKSSEIAIAAVDPEGDHLVLGECKYQKEPVGINALQELEVKADAVDWRRGSRHVWYVLFSVAGFTEQLRGLAAAREDIFLFDDSQK
ncbi:MAG: ATP-binding protein [Lachnospiraceae bacterium]|jgi:Predicted ATPase (AAA+ superfamily)|nr:ATP-binding protein [Lachnospiraceae bacterium]MCI9677084.1 ATP-binding protein [Lachnospiraceae bacterium]